MGNRCPPVPDAVGEALRRYPVAIERRLLEVRALIFEVAAGIEGVGPLTETLTWGEAAYLTEASRSGSTIRLGIVKAVPGRAAVLFNCRTNLVEMGRERFGDELVFEGKRAVLLPVSGALPVGALGSFIAAALTHHWS